MNMIQRAVARLLGIQGRSYDGAKTVARFNDFTKSGNSANAELDVAMTTLRNRARGLYRNDPFVRRWVNQVQANVIGDAGLRLQCRAVVETTNKPDQYGNDAYEAAWVDWCKFTTADGMMSFREACKLTVRSWARDGECFVEIARGPQFRHGIALHFFEPDMVDETFNASNYKSSGNDIRQGIEIDKFGKPVAYHVTSYHPGDAQWGHYDERKHRRITADKIIHVFIKDRPGQVRGEPPMSSIMTSTKMLSGYREAEVTGRRLAASKMGFFKRIFSEGTGAFSSLATSEADDGNLEIEVAPGSLTTLPPGVDFEKFDMTSFSTDYEQFERQILRSVAAGLNISYANVSMDNSNSSYSADRSDQIKQRDVWRDLQQMFIEQFANKVHTLWNPLAFSFGHVGNVPIRKAGKFLNASYFTARGWSWVDPDKEIKAASRALALNITSISRIAAEQGRDPQDIFKEIAADRELAATHGVDLTHPDEKKLEHIQTSE